MDNTTRRQLLELTKQAQQQGFKGSVVDVYKNPQILQQGVEVAATPQQQQQGLRGRERQNAPEAMVFPNVPPNTSMNTKGMQFPVDMDMYDQKGHLVHSYKNVPPGVDSLPTGPRGATVIERPSFKTGGKVKAQTGKIEDLIVPYGTKILPQVTISTLSDQSYSNLTDPQKTVYDAFGGNQTASFSYESRANPTDVNPQTRKYHAAGKNPQKGEYPARTINYLHNKYSDDIHWEDALRMVTQTPGIKNIYTKPSQGAKNNPNKYNIEKKSSNFRPHARLERNTMYIPPVSDQVNRHEFMGNLLPETAHFKLADRVNKEYGKKGYDWLEDQTYESRKARESIEEEYPDATNYLDPYDLEYQTHYSPRSAEGDLFNKYNFTNRTRIQQGLDPITDPKYFKNRQYGDQTKEFSIYPNSSNTLIDVTEKPKNQFYKKQTGGPDKLTASDFEFTTDRSRANARYSTDPETGEVFPLVALPEAVVETDLPRDEQGRPIFSSSAQKDNYYAYKHLGEEGVRKMRDMKSGIRKTTGDFARNYGIPAMAAAAAAASGPLGAAISRGASSISPFLTAPLTVGSRTIPFINPTTVAGTAFGVKGTTDLGTDLNTGYYNNPNIPKINKFTRGLETGLNISGIPGMGNALLQTGKLAIQEFNNLSQAGNITMQGVKQGVNRTGKLVDDFLTPRIDLSRYNKKRFQPETGKYYRQVGKPAIDDAFETGLIRGKREEVERLLSWDNTRRFNEEVKNAVQIQEKNQGFRHGDYPYFQRSGYYFGGRRAKPTRGNYLIETDLPAHNFTPSHTYRYQFPRSEYNPVTGKFDDYNPITFDTVSKGVPQPKTVILNQHHHARKVISPFSGKPHYNFYEPHWWKGYKKMDLPEYNFVPKKQSLNPSTSEIDEALKKIFRKNVSHPSSYTHKYDPPYIGRIQKEISKEEQIRRSAFPSNSGVKFGADDWTYFDRYGNPITKKDYYKRSK